MTTLNQLKGLREVEDFLAVNHEEWRDVPRMYIFRYEEALDGLTISNKVWHWIKTGQVLGGDRSLMDDFKMAIGYFRRMFRSRSANGKYVIAITDEHRTMFPVLNDYKEVVIERRGRKRSVRIT